MSFPTWFINVQSYATQAFQDDVEMSISPCGKWIKLYDNNALISYNPNNGTFSGVKVLNISVRDFLTYFVLNDPNHTEFGKTVREFLQNP